MPIPGGFRILAAVGALIATLALTTAFAAVVDLRSGLLKPADVPVGFSATHTKVYTHFTRNESVKWKTSPTSSNGNSCAVPASFKGDGWTQGLIQIYVGKNGYSTVGWCGDLFATAEGAHTAYLTMKTLVKSALKAGAVKRISSKVGDESLLIGIGTTVGKVYIGEFRHQNALIRAVYTGPGSFTPSNLVTLTTRINTRLQ
jgi:hypothetical protein